MERELESRNIIAKQMEEKDKMIHQELGAQKNEINYLSGKCSTMKRDLEYAERFNNKFKDQNTMI